MSFTPASSLASAVISGSVSVSNFPASQAVTGPLTDAQLRAVAVPVSGSVSVGNFPATQPVSGTVTANQGTAGTAWPISAASLPLPTGAAKDSTLTDTSQRVGGTVTVDASGVAVPVTGPLTNAQLRASAVPVDASSVAVPVTGPLTDAQIRATALPVSGTVAATIASLPLPSGAATEASLADAVGALNDVGLTAILERERMETTG